MFLFGPLLHFTLFISNIRFIFREIPLGFLNSGILSPLNILMIAVASLILCLMMLLGLTGHLWFSNNTTIRTFPSLLVWKKAFPFLESYLKSHSLRTRNLNLAIPFFFIFSTLFTVIFPTNSRSCIWQHRFHSTFLTAYFNIFSLDLTIRQVIVTLLSRAIRCT